MPRDKAGRFAPQQNQTDQTTEDHTQGDNSQPVVYEALKRLIRKPGPVGYAVALGVVLSAAIVPISRNWPEIMSVIGNVIAEPAQAVPVSTLPSRVIITTYDSSEPDPAKRRQYREVTFKASDNIEGTWKYKNSDRSGAIVGSKGLGDSIGLMYSPDDHDGPSMGYIMLRRLHFREKSAPPVWVGFEVGHDCSCGNGNSKPGPFTSVPAILSTSTEPPEDIANVVFTKPTQTEDFYFPDALVEQIGKKR